MADPDYRAVVTVGTHTFDVDYGDNPDPAVPMVTLPLSMGWSIPDTVDYFPAQRNPASGSFGIVTPTLDLVSDITVGDLVHVEVYTPAAAAAPWQSVYGVVTQLDADLKDRRRLTVYFTDPLWILGQQPVGIGAWPLEDVGDRVARVCAELGITLDEFTNESSMGLLAARGANAPTDGLAAIRDAYKDDADRNPSYGGGVFVYGRPVYAYDPIDRDLVVRVFERRVTRWPGELGADGTIHHRAGVEGALAGAATQSDGHWTRLMADRPTYVLVDGIVFGDVIAGAVPYVRNTSYVDGPGPTFPSATARTYLGRSLVPDDSSQNVTAWRTSTVRHLSYLDPDPVAGWIGDDDPADFTFGLSWAALRPVVIDPIDPTLTLDGRTWIAGVLSGARLTIPPGGRFYIDLTLRPELLAQIAGTPTGEAATYADIPAALTYADLDPLMTYRDLRLIGA